MAILETITTMLQANPRFSVIIVSLVVSFFISLVQYLVMNKEKVRELKDKQKALNDEMKLHKDNPEKLMDLQKQMLAHSMETMKHSFKPMLITTIPILLFFAFIRPVYAATTIAGSWFWYYFVVAILSSMVFRKLFKLP